MSDINLDYPALYKAAGAHSGSSQTLYLRFLKTEYILLIFASVLSLDKDPDIASNLIYVAIFALGLILLIYREAIKPEQGWYRGRALAESVKTSAWRYCMRASPFERHADIKHAREEFRKHLLEILEANRHVLGERVPVIAADATQITPSMDSIRALALPNRKKFYLERRVQEQRIWYAKKANENKRASKRWQAACITVYGAAGILILTRIAAPSWKFWPIEPLLVAASSMIGWMQIKKFNELASSYTLTAHEIGILQGRIGDADCEPEFSAFVNEAELAFSREHTHWVARQTS